MKKCFLPLLLPSLLSFALLLFSCSEKKEKLGDSSSVCTSNAPDPQMQQWIDTHSDKDAEGWYNVKWNEVCLADLTHETDSNTNDASQKIVDELNAQFMNSQSANPNPDQYGDYYDTGVLVHGVDDSDKDDLFHPLRYGEPIVATSYIRSDLTKNVKRSIWNSTFHLWALGLPSAGVILQKHPRN